MRLDHFLSFFSSVDFREIRRADYSRLSSFTLGGVSGGCRLVSLSRERMPVEIFTKETRARSLCFCIIDVYFCCFHIYIAGKIDFGWKGAGTVFEG